MTCRANSSRDDRAATKNLRRSREDPVPGGGPEVALCGRMVSAQLPLHTPAHAQYASASRLRQEPFLLLFPLGAALAWAGVLHWLFFALGVTQEYRSIFHSLAQVEGFLACFASGFLLTFVPRRTRSQAASSVEIALAAALPLLTVAFAWAERWALSQIFWIALLVMLAQFALRRIGRAEGTVPPAFVWVAVALLSGLVGSVLAGVGAARGDEGMWLHDVGRGLVLQGVFTGLVLGTGSFLLPAIARGQTPPDARRSSRDRALFAGHLLLGAALVASFFVEQLVSVRAGFALRTAVVLAALLPTRPWRLPTLPGLHRRIAWVAQWMLPLGYAWVAVAPEQRRIGLHVVFIGCFAALVLAVSIHVTLSHSERAAQLSRTTPLLVALCALLAIALLARLLVDLDPAHLLLWIGVASSSFLAASLAWAAVLLSGRKRVSTARGSIVAIAGTVVLVGAMHQENATAP